ncbi:hypothetical protein JXA85_08270 [Candidatus Woesearchaeota archaeon]|nr:hypothetical protein [Candidatus Woesearchaeota archaeon]
MMAEWRSRGVVVYRTIGIHPRCIPERMRKDNISPGDAMMLLDDSTGMTLLNSDFHGSNTDDYAPFIKTMNLLDGKTKNSIIRAGKNFFNI